MNDHSPRVNSARLANYISQSVRLTCKLLDVKNDTAVVQASDDGEVQVRLPMDVSMSSTYIEVIGQVIDPSTVKMLAVINLGDELDMKLVNEVVELWHDPRFSNIVQPSPD